MKAVFQNELIKTWRQGAYRVFLFLLIGLLLISPLFWKLFLQHATDGISVETLYESNEQIIQASEKEEPLWVNFLKAQNEGYRFFMDHQLDETWKYKMCFGDLCETIWTCRFAEQAAEGRWTTEQLEREEYQLPDAFYYTWKQLTAEDYRAMLPTLREDLEKAKTDILALTAEEYLLELADHCILAAEDLEAQLKKLTDPSLHEYITTQYQAEYLPVLAQRYRELAASGKSFDDWEYRAIDHLDQVYSRICASLPMLREEYETEMRGVPYAPSYDEYLAGKEAVIRVMEDARVALTYALENDICPPELEEDSTKLAVTSTVLTYSGLFTVLLTVMMVQSVTSEFTSGTIRLLVIRPRTRAKLLGGKVLTVLFWSGVLYLGGFVLALLENPLFHGIGDLFVPEICVLGGTAFTMPSILYLLGKISLGWISTLFVVSIALLFAVLLTKPAGALILSVVITGIGSSVQTGILTMRQFIPGLDILKYTILCNFDLSGLFASPLGAAGITENPLEVIQALLGGNSVTSPIGILANVLVVVLHIALFGVLAFMNFRKKEIKN